MQLEDLENLADQDIHFSEKPKVTEIISFWPFLRALLIASKSNVGPKADAVIDKIIRWGDAITTLGGIFTGISGFVKRLIR